MDNDIAVQEVNRFILSVKNNKATGCDSIPPEAWKTRVTADKEAASLTKLFNTIRDKRLFPREWKRALIQPIYKKGNQRGHGIVDGFHYY